MSHLSIRWIGIALAVLLISAVSLADDKDNDKDDAPTQFNEATITHLQDLMNSGKLTSEELTRYYITRIEKLDKSGPRTNSIIELNPDAVALAQNADKMRKSGATTAQFPLLGIPIVLKDNIDTGDKMQTTAGSFALFGQPATADSTVVQKLRAAGAVILGKTTLSEWANFRSFFSSSGWSGRGGLSHNPYSTDRNACGSSSGSGAAASGNFATVSIGSETDGSIVCPGNVNGVVGLKPTIGLVSRGGVVPISHTQDTTGPHARTLADAVIVLNVAVWRSATADPRDPTTGGVPLGWQACNNPSPAVVCSPDNAESGKSRPNLATIDYRTYLNPNGLSGAVLGLTRSGITGSTPQVVAAFYAAINAMVAAGAHIMDLDNMNCAGITSGCTNANVDLFASNAGAGELLVLEYDFKNDLHAYFSTRVGVPVAPPNDTLQGAINFNNAHANVEMPYFGQEIFLQAQALNTADPTFVQPAFGMSYNQGLLDDHQLGVNIDNALHNLGLDAIVAPTDSPAWTTDLILGDHFEFASSGLGGSPGYPIIQVPSGEVLGMPVGVSFIGTAFSEPTLIRLASGFEAATHARFEPTFSSDITRAHTFGTSLKNGKADDDNHKPHHHM